MLVLQSSTTDYYKPSMPTMSGDQQSTLCSPISESMSLNILFGLMTHHRGAATADGELALGATCWSPSCPGRATTSRTPSSAARSCSRTTPSPRSTSRSSTVEIRETKLGREEITRDCPMSPRAALRKLDEDGLICVGTKVSPATSWSARSRPSRRPS